MRCPCCQQECNLADAIANDFVSNVDPNSSSDGCKSTEDDVKMCTGCEENIPGTSYCVECSEYLCDQCVQAHRRVKLTKEHTIVPKNEAQKPDEVLPGDKAVILMCPLHKYEALKLYCDTCDKLTCRDCQLHSHKEHK